MIEDHFIHVQSIGAGQNLRICIDFIYRIAQIRGKIRVVFTDEPVIIGDIYVILALCE